MRQYKSCCLPAHRIYNVANCKTYEVEIDFRVNTAAAYDRMLQYTAEVCEECPFGADFVDSVGGRISGPGEGIVWTMVRTPYMEEDEEHAFDDTLLCNFKTKGKFDTVNNTTVKPQQSNVPSTLLDAAADFAEYALGERRFEQGIEYLEGEQARKGEPRAGYNVKLTGAFIEWVAADAMKEEAHEMEQRGIPQKLAKAELVRRAKQWYARRCNEVRLGSTPAPG
jgi:hypothetical protein